MRQLTDAEVKTRAESLKKRHRSEWCRLVMEACVGRSMGEVSRLMGYSTDWVRDHLRRFAIESASGGGDGHRPLIASGEKRDTQQQVKHVVKQYAPAEPDAEYVAEYEAEGHTPEVAKCLALSYQAGESAIEAGAVEVTS